MRASGPLGVSEMPQQRSLQRLEPFPMRRLFARFSRATRVIHFPGFLSSARTCEGPGYASDRDYPVPLSSE